VLDNPPLEVTIAFLTGYLTFLPATALGVSGVLAVVTAGVYMGWYTPELTTAKTRLQGEAVWEIVTFMLNATLFVLVGLELRPIVESLGDRSTGDLLLWAAAVSATVIATRAAWSWIAANLQWRILPMIRDPARMPGNGVLAVLSWAGMRGAVTLAAALALPLATDAGSPLAERNVIVFLAFAVIVATLVIQGLTLPALVRAVDLPVDSREPQEEAYAWVRAMEAGLARLEELHDEPWVEPAVVQRLRDTFDLRIAQYAARKEGVEDRKAEKLVRASQRLRLELLSAERGAVVELRRSGEISDSVERQVFRELDLEDARLGGG
jgi:CPA1 family monovalent cation:H+ antiporter